METRTWEGPGIVFWSASYDLHEGLNVRPLDSILYNVL